MPKLNDSRRISTVFLFVEILLLAMPFGRRSQAQEEYVLHEFERKQLTDTYFSEGISIGDINGDDHRDIVYGPYWFAGPDFTIKHEIFPAKPQPTEGYANHFFSWIYDFDGDGANDVLTVGLPGSPAYVYQNPSRGQGAWKKHEVFDWVSNESPRLIDLVGDERPELVCTRDGFFGFATVDWSQPFSTWKFHPISERVTAVRFGHGLGIGDVNGDGRMDLLHAGGWYEQPEENALDRRWKPHTVKFSQAYGGAEMYAYDVDGDGDNDVITSEAAHDFGLAWYEQTGPDQFQRHLIMGAHPSENRYGVLFSELHSLNLQDIDGDGLKDIVTGKTYWSHHKQSPMWDAGAVVYWFKLVRGADGIDWLPYQAHGETGIGRQIAVADINGDGQLDIATGGMLGANLLLQSTRSVSEEEHAKSQPKVYDGPRPRDTSNARALRGPRPPIGSDGKVAQAIEGERVRANVTAGQARNQPMNHFAGGRWSGDGQLWWTGAKPGDRLTLELDALRDIEAVEVAMTCARDYGVIELQIDGQPLGDAIDLYNPEVISTGLLEFKTPGLKAGKHRLTFEILGANPKAAKAYMFGLDFIRFRGVGEQFPVPEDGSIRPTDTNGRVLNLDFETGTLADWNAEGQAFAGQPIEGDTVSARRSDMRSQHFGKYWIGGYEKLQDAPVGTLTSVPFKVTARFASFYLAGGNTEKTRVELVAVDEDEPFYTISGNNTETLRQIVVDLRRVEGRPMQIRLVDESRGGWGHLNFDHFRFHAKRPGPLTPATQHLADDEYPHLGLPAGQAAKAMNVPEGFQVTVCAAEPDVRQPIAMALDDRGRTWIAEAYEYPQRAAGDRGRDRILVFEDTTGDGKFDSRKVFYEGLNLVSGLEVGFGGVWVGAAPYLMFIPDRNGDDVPDGDPEILLDGWAFQDTHETLNAFCWGPDGWLYGCHGVFTHSNVGRPGTPDEQRTPINAGIWRYHPRRHTFEVFAHGTSNPWGVDFNEHGEAFATACVIPHLYHIIPGARYQRQAGRHFNPYTYDDIKTIADHLHYLGATPHSGNGKSDEAGGGHAHAGAMIYQGGVWPEEYHGALFMNNIHGQRLNMDRLIPQGSGYVGTHAPDFLLTGDMASQILNMRYGPDGQVTMIDWYDMQACHRREVEVHDRSNGRIYKISYVGKDGKSGATQQPDSVNLAELPDVELAELCTHSNNWYVRHARRLLQERSKVSAAAGERLITLAKTHPDATIRLRALWALHGVSEFEPNTQNLDRRTLLRHLAGHDAAPVVRGWAVRLLLEQQQPIEARDRALLQELAAEDSSPVVRRQIVSALLRLRDAQPWEILERLIRDSDASDHNLPLMLWYALEPLADENPDRALAIGLSAGTKIPLLREFMLRRLGGAGGEQAIERLVTGLQNTSSPAVRLTFLTAIRSALTGQRKVPKPAGWDTIYSELRTSNQRQISLEASALGTLFGDEAATQHLRQAIRDSTLDTSHRLRALEALLSAKPIHLDRTLLDLMDAADHPTALRQAAIGGLAQYDRPEIAMTLVDRYQDLGADERRAAIATLCGRAEAAKVLLSAMGDGRIPTSDLTADLARQLEYLGDNQVLQQLQEVWGQVRKTPAEKTELIQQYQQLVSRTDLPAADMAFGRAIFAKTCQRCHRLYGVGDRLGPDLTGSNRANLDYLMENIVDPSALMANEYRQSIFLTKDGQIVTGIVRSETDRAVIVQTAEAEVVLPKEEIAQRRASDVSMMPENQLHQFSEHEIRSLIAYLRSKNQTPMLATEDNAATLFNGQDLSGWTGNTALWSVEQGEIVGTSRGLGKNEFLVSDLSAADFRLSLEIKLVGDVGNSGIQFRSQAQADGSVQGYQADVGPDWWGKLYEEHGRGLLWEQGGASQVRAGHWNQYEIEASGTRIRTWINGQLCVDLDDPHGAQAGVFAIQLHSGGPMEVRVRNLKLEVLSGN